MPLLTINAGSSSLKLALYDDAGMRKASLSIDKIGALNHLAALEDVFVSSPEMFPPGTRAIGHRLVHGGRDHHAPEQITPALMGALQQLCEIDPTHTPRALAVIEAVSERFPDVPQFACFDTAFHRSIPPVAQRYPLPKWTADMGVLRYGFHGLSCESIVSQLESIDQKAVGGRLVIAHLGNGASVTAVQGRMSVDTSMGFSPTGGLMMGTRCGDLDPTIITYLGRACGLSLEQLEKLVDQESGLLGASGISEDMRDLLNNRAGSDAIDLYCYIARKHFGALAAVLGGVDTIIFTGGIGEHAAPVRENICRGLEYLGVQIDATRNAQDEPVISRDGSRVTVRVMATDENLVIARHVLRLLSERST